VIVLHDSACRCSKRGVAEEERWSESRQAAKRPDSAKSRSNNTVTTESVEVMTKDEVREVNRVGSVNK
jgi:hypothetical protein